MTRDRLAATAATVLVSVTVFLGLHAMGGPKNQRLIQSDLRTVKTLANFAQNIKATWEASNKILPATIDDVPVGIKQGPVDGLPFTYRPKSHKDYELCAIFETKNEMQASQMGYEWAHPKGNYCFQLDASQPVPQAPFNY